MLLLAKIYMFCEDLCNSLDIQSIYSGIAVDVEFYNIERQIYIFPFKVEKCKT